MPTEEMPDGLVVLTFDDGNRSDAELVAPLLRSHGFGATFFITLGLGWQEDKQHCLTWEQVQGLAEQGFEIGNHTVEHGDPRRQPRADFGADVARVERALADHGLPHPTSFAYPGYHFGRTAVGVLAERGYRFARRGMAPEQGQDAPVGRSYDPADDHPLLVPTTWAAGPHATEETFRGALARARDGKAAVLVFHGVPDRHPWVDTRPAFFERCVQILSDGGHQVVSMGDLARYVAPDAGPADPFTPLVRRAGAGPVSRWCELGG